MNFLKRSLIIPTNSVNYFVIKFIMGATDIPALWILTVIIVKQLFIITLFFTFHHLPNNPVILDTAIAKLIVIATIRCLFNSIFMLDTHILAIIIIIITGYSF